MDLKAQLIRLDVQIGWIPWTEQGTSLGRGPRPSSQVAPFPLHPHQVLSKAVSRGIVDGAITLEPPLTE